MTREPNDDLGISRERRQVLANVVVAIRRSFEKGNEWGAYVYARDITDIHEQLWLWLQLDDAPDIRAAIKRFQIAERAYDAENERDDPEQVSKGR